MLMRLCGFCPIFFCWLCPSAAVTMRMVPPMLLVVAPPAAFLYSSLGTLLSTWHFPTASSPSPCSFNLYPPFLFMLFLCLGKKNWVASLGILSGSSSGPSFPLYSVSRLLLYVLYSLISHVPLSAKTQNPKQVSLNPKAQPLQITSPANLLLDTRTRTNQGGWLSFSLLSICYF